MFTVLPWIYLGVLITDTEQWNQQFDYKSERESRNDELDNSQGTRARVEVDARRSIVGAMARLGLYSNSISVLLDVWLHVCINQSL